MKKMTSRQRKMEQQRNRKKDPVFRIHSWFFHASGCEATLACQEVTWRLKPRMTQLPTLLQMLSCGTSGTSFSACSWNPIEIFVWDGPKLSCQVQLQGQCQTKVTVQVTTTLLFYKCLIHCFNCQRSMPPVCCYGLIAAI